MRINHVGERAMSVSWRLGDFILEHIDCAIEAGSAHEIK